MIPTRGGSAVVHRPAVARKRWPRRPSRILPIRRNRPRSRMIRGNVRSAKFTPIPRPCRSLLNRSSRRKRFSRFGFASYRWACVPRPVAIWRGDRPSGLDPRLVAPGMHLVLCVLAACATPTGGVCLCGDRWFLEGKPAQGWFHETLIVGERQGNRVGMGCAVEAQVHIGPWLHGVGGAWPCIHRVVVGRGCRRAVV